MTMALRSAFAFEDQKLQQMVSNELEMNRYTKKTKVKAGIFEKKQVNAKEMLKYLIDEFPFESNVSFKRLRNFDISTYSAFIRSLSILSDAQRTWLLHIIPFRKNKVIQWVEKEVL
jgi:hypothetical protein